MLRLEYMKPTSETLHYEPVQPSVRRRFGSGENYRPEPVQIIYSAEPRARSRRRTQVVYDLPTRPAVGGTSKDTRRRRQDEVENAPEPMGGGIPKQTAATTFHDFFARVDAEEKAAPIPESPQPDAAQYAKEAWGQAGSEVPYISQDTKSSDSPISPRIYNVDEVPRAQAYKAADTDAYVLDEPMYDRQFRPPSPIGGDLDAYEEFNFSFPAREPPKEDLSDLESPAVETDSSHRGDSEVSRPSNATQVFLSRYTGGAELGGSHSAELTTLHDLKGRRRPLFQWL